MISARVSEIDTNITGMDAQTGEEGQARIDMTVQIKDVKHLDRVIRALRGVDQMAGQRTSREQPGPQVLRRAPDHSLSSARRSLTIAELNTMVWPPVAECRFGDRTASTRLRASSAFIPLAPT